VINKSLISWPLNAMPACRGTSNSRTHNYGFHKRKLVAKQNGAIKWMGHGWRSRCVRTASAAGATSVQGGESLAMAKRVASLQWKPPFISCELVEIINSEQELLQRCTCSKRALFILGRRAARYRDTVAFWMQERSRKSPSTDSFFIPSANLKRKIKSPIRKVKSFF
jgi:hypothetical protein